MTGQRGLDGQLQSVLQLFYGQMADLTLDQRSGSGHQYGPGLGYFCQESQLLVLVIVCCSQSSLVWPGAGV